MSEGESLGQNNKKSIQVGKSAEALIVWHEKKAKVAMLGVRGERWRCWIDVGGRKKKINIQGEPILERVWTCLNAKRRWVSSPQGRGGGKNVKKKGNKLVKTWKHGLSKLPAETKGPKWGSSL